MACRTLSESQIPIRFAQGIIPLSFRTSLRSLSTSVINFIHFDVDPF